MDEIRYRPIGVVHSPIRKENHIPPHRRRSKTIEGTVEVYPEYAGGLQDLDGFSHIVLLCHLHLSSGHALVVKPPSDAVTHGVFATRSPRRPNPISMTVVRLTGVDGSTLRVVGLDLVEGTPVLDIKPYIPVTSETDEVRLGWLEGKSGNKG